MVDLSTSERGVVSVVVCSDWSVVGHDVVAVSLGVVALRVAVTHGGGSWIIVGLLGKSGSVNFV